MHTDVPYSCTRWPNRFVDADQIARFLDITPAALHQLIRTHAFPPPAPRSPLRSEEWPLATVLSYVLVQHPRQARHVPRLFPRAGDPVPALFLGAQHFNIGSAGYVAYLWQPSDGARPVAIAYSLGGPGDHHRAGELLTALQLQGVDVAALAIPTNSAYVGPDEVLEPPDVDYADDSGSTIDVGRVAWLDVAYLLQVDIPWWPRTLRDVPTMLGWQPGDPVCPVVPRHPITGDPRALLRLGATLRVHTACTNAQTADRFFQWWAYRAACEMSSVADRDARTLPGITVPAHPIAPEPGAELSPADESVDADRPTASETTQVLHSRVDPDAFDDTIRQLTYAFGIWSPVIEAVIGVPASPANPLARQWLSRLQKSDAPVDELGYLHVCAFGIGDQRRAHPDAQPAPRRLTDPLHPDLWIAHIGDTVYVTVPRSISRASGMLRQLDITRETNAGAGELTAWWTDSNGDAWPMPGTDQYEAGFDGSGPRDLAAAASLLADDATSPVAGVHNCRARAEAGCEQLARLLTARQHPTLFRRITGPGGHTVWHTD